MINFRKISTSARFLKSCSRCHNQIQRRYFLEITTNTAKIVTPRYLIIILQQKFKKIQPSSF